MIVAGGALTAFIAAILFVVLPKGRPLVEPPAISPVTEDAGGAQPVPSDAPSEAETMTRAAAVALASTRTATATSTVTPAPTASPTPTGTASSTSTATPTASEMPSATASPTGTATPTPVTIAVEPTSVDELPIGLYYDASTLVLLNRSTQNVDLSGLVFSQRQPDGSELTFKSDLWPDAEALRPSNCFQVWTNRYLELPQPLNCVERQGWRSVSHVRMFWMSNLQDATFEVRRGSLVLATCRTDALSCAFDPGGRPSS